VFGLVVWFELRDAVAAEAFDRLVAETGERIRASEPGTLAYVVHTVEGHPLSRLFYEVYADRAAFEAHEATEHVRRFLTEREAYVATFRVELVTPVGGTGLPG